METTKTFLRITTEPLNMMRKFTTTLCLRRLRNPYNYLKPFYTYDLDTIYSVEWDSAEKRWF